MVGPLERRRLRWTQGQLALALAKLIIPTRARLSDDPRALSCLLTVSWRIGRVAHLTSIHVTAETRFLTLRVAPFHDKRYLVMGVRFLRLSTPDYLN